jgi:hypothetical protein
MGEFDVYRVKFTANLARILHIGKKLNFFKKRSMPVSNIHEFQTRDLSSCLTILLDDFSPECWIRRFSVISAYNLALMHNVRHADPFKS